jgi:DNA-binding CsgD family transcriptional regulator
MGVAMANDGNRPGFQYSSDEWWLREVALINRVRAVRDESGLQKHSTALQDIESVAPSRTGELIAQMGHYCVDELSTLPRTATQHAQRLTGAALRLQQLAIDWHVHEAATHGRRLADCAAALARLREINDVNALFDAACEELVVACGFHRASVSKVERDGWKPMVLHDRSGLTATSWFSDWIDRTVPFTDAAPEREALHQRRASLVFDTAQAPVYRPFIIQSGRSQSYVSAALTVGAEAIGLFHADHFPLDRRVDSTDRDILGVFATGVSHIYDCLMSAHRLLEYRDAVRNLLGEIIDNIDAVCEPFAVSTSPAGNVGSPGESGRVHLADPAVGLTRREAEVLHLMVLGESNRHIAEELVISEDTVKSHVQRILRKYGVVSRAQAIATALQRR